MEKPNNLLCDTNETFLCKQMARLIKVCLAELVKKTSKSKLFRACLISF